MSGPETFPPSPLKIRPANGIPCLKTLCGSIQLLRAAKESTARPRPRFADVEPFNMREYRRVLIDQIGQATQNRLPISGGHGGPTGVSKGIGCRTDGIVYVGALGSNHTRRYPAVARIYVSKTCHPSCLAHPDRQ